MKHIEQLESVIKVKQSQFQETLKSNSLDTLWDTGVSLVINIDEIIAELGELVRQYNNEIHEIVRTRAEVDVNHLLDEIGARMEEVLSRASEESVNEHSFFAELGIDQFEIDEMLVDTKSVPERQEGEHTQQEKNEHMVMQKLRMLVSLLYAHDCRTKDFYTVHGKNSPGTMRYRPYVLVVIPKWNRMVLINAGYGAATFVIPGLHGWKEISTRNGDELQEELGAYRIAYYGESQFDGDEKWKEEVTRYLFKDNEQNDTLDMKGLQKQEVYRYYIQNHTPTPEAWMGMTQAEKLNFKSYGGKGLFAIAGIFGVKGNPTGYSRVMAELGMKIYGSHKVFDHALAENPTESWTREFWKMKLLEQIPTPEAWMEMSVVEKKKFKPYGNKGLIAIAGIFGVKGNPRNSQVMAELGRKIYGEHKVFEELLAEDPTVFWTREIWKMKLIEKVLTPGAWMTISGGEKEKFKPYGGKGLIAISRIFGIKGDPTSNSRVMAELGVQIYGDHKVFDELLAENPTVSWTQVVWKMKLLEKVPTPEEWMRMSAAEKKNFKPYGNKGLLALAGIFGVKGSPISYNRVLAELGVQIYGVGHECIECELWSEKEWQMKLIERVPTLEAWMRMTYTEKEKFKPYGNKGLIAIAGVFGVKGDTVSNSRVMAELGRKIYGDHMVFDDALAENPTESWTQEVWKMKLLEKVPTPEAWMRMSAKEKLNFKPYGGKGLIAIAGIFGVTGNPIGYSRVMTELGKKIYGDHQVFDK